MLRGFSGEILISRSVCDNVNTRETCIREPVCLARGMALLPGYTEDGPAPSGWVLFPLNCSPSSFPVLGFLLKPSTHPDQDSSSIAKFLACPWLQVMGTQDVCLPFRTAVGRGDAEGPLKSRPGWLSLTSLSGRPAVGSPVGLCFCSPNSHSAIAVGATGPAPLDWTLINCLLCPEYRC